MQPVKLIVIGGGGRGTGYAEYAREFPARAKVVGVAEPRDFYRNRLATTHQIPPDRAVTCWTQMAARDKFADAVLICTQDNLHVDPAIAFARKGYAILLEKPMAPDEQGCRRIVQAVVDSDVLLAVGHVMRYTTYTRKLKQLLVAGRIGEIVSIQHLEPVGYWHQAHSYVRGNWRNEAESSFMLLSKSCHDLDWLRHVMDRRCEKVSSFGSLHHFRRASQPAGAADRCLDCSVESACPYSAKKIYLDRVARGDTEWPSDVLTPTVTVASVTEALRTGPYGRCVYACDNDVVDHQVVTLQFAGGATASFTMTAFAEMGHRRTTVFGTRGEIRGDGEQIQIYDFLSDELETIKGKALDAGLLGGHGGGDFGLMQGFVDAVASGDRSKVLSGPAETLESHLMVFAAERARGEDRVVEIDL